MMKKVKFLVLLVLVAAMTLITAGRSDAGEPKAVDKSKWPQRMTLAAGPTGSFSYTMGSPWASNIGTILGVSISTESTAGLPVNTIMINNKQAEIGICSTDIAYDALVGADWNQGKKQENVRAMAVFDSNVMQFYTNRRSGITTFKGMNGKSVNPSRAKSELRHHLPAAHQGPRRQARKDNQRQPRRCKRQPRRRPARRGGLHGQHSPPGPVRVRGQPRYGDDRADREEAKKFTEQYPALSVTEIPANTYKNQKEPVIYGGQLLDGHRQQRSAGQPGVRNDQGHVRQQENAGCSLQALWPDRAEEHHPFPHAPPSRGSQVLRGDRRQDTRQTQARQVTE